jgi:hypothetical protein
LAVPTEILADGCAESYSAGIQDLHQGRQKDYFGESHFGEQWERGEIASNWVGASAPENLAQAGVGRNQKA